MPSNKLLYTASLVAALFLGRCSAHAQVVPPTPAPVSIACAQNTILPSLASGQFGWAQCDPNGRLYSSPIGYTPIGSYTSPLAVTTTSANTLLPVGTTTVTVYNTGANPAYIKFGPSNAVMATTSNEVVPPGGGCGFYVYPNTYLAAVTASSTTSLNISSGTGGAMPCWGGTGSSGGGPTSNVTVVAPLGVTALSGSIPVTFESSTSVYQEATITTGGIAQNICAGATPANGFEIINISATEILYFREAGAAAVGGSVSVPIQVGAAFTSPTGYKPTGLVSVNATTTAHPLIARCY